MSVTPNLCCDETKSRGTYTRMTLIIITSYFFFSFFFFLTCAGSPLPCKGFSQVAGSGVYSPVAVLRLFIAVASHVAEHGLQGAWISCGTWALEHRLSSLVALWHVGFSRTRNLCSCFGRWILNHCTTREVHILCS